MQRNSVWRNEELGKAVGARKTSCVENTNAIRSYNRKKNVKKRKKTRKKEMDADRKSIQIIMWPVWIDAT